MPIATALAETAARCSETSIGDGIGMVAMFAFFAFVIWALSR